eukprot:TRINITY_DN7480_c0_g1_i1.p1 TRINITY_DN7480_c0_g1~~TRINITY_DN7480_c0_g1_i1.p1  ORF type:complete len:134 (-),score=10.95 TRINITY_DN7480_c0_g1_i1:41-442(-)
MSSTNQKHIDLVERNSAIGYTPVIKTKPKYPIIHHNPSIHLMTRNIRFGDLAEMFGLTFIGAIAGYMGAPVYRSFGTGAGVFMGFTASLLITYNTVASRLTGFLENDKEVKKYRYRLDTLHPRSVPIHIKEDK